MFIRVILCCLIAALLPAVGHAQNCRQRTVVVANQCAPYVAPAVVVKDVVNAAHNDLAVAQFLAIPVAVPAAFATYLPGYAQAPITQAAPIGQPVSPVPPQATDPMSVLLARLDRIEAKLGGAGVEMPYPDGAAAGPRADPAVQFMVSTCSACHTEATKAKGKNFVLIVGGQINPALTPKQINKVARQIETDTMPPGGKNSEANWKATNEWRNQWFETH